MAGDETSTLLGSLERQRATFAWKCSGLDGAGMRATVGASKMNPGWAGQAPGADRGRLLHATSLGRDMRSLWPDADVDDPDCEWRSADNDSPEQLLARWRDAVERSRAAVTAVLADGDLGQLVKFTEWDAAPSLRRVLVDIIEEYARHARHADLIRESVDGLTGEDPPR